MFQLKDYQQRGVHTLAQFFDNCRKMDINTAFQQALAYNGLPAVPYREYCFNEMPYICLRIPTGGGKTVLGAYAVVTTAKHYLQQLAPLVIWLVPSNTIRQQTVKALKNHGPPYRRCLNQAFSHVMVLDIDEVEQVKPQDIGDKTIVVVSTLQNLRVTDTSGRQIYAYKENFEPHFNRLLAAYPECKQRLEIVQRGDLNAHEHGLTADNVGQINYSFANLLAIQQPIVIMDEAHNARTRLTFDTLKRIHPAAIIELTATPDIPNADQDANVSKSKSHNKSDCLRAQFVGRLGRSD